jgi:hypothetical protein
MRHFRELLHQKEEAYCYAFVDPARRRRVPKVSGQA